MASRSCAVSLVLILSTLTVSPAPAAEGLFLSWLDCAAGSAAASNLEFACDTDAGSSALYCGLMVPQPTDSILGVEIVVDFQHAAPVLPDWWRFDVGGCHAGSLTADDQFTGLSACRDVWLGQASGGLLSYTVGMPYGGANQARMRVALSVPSNEARTMNATDMYYAARLLFSHAKTVGGEACTGCSGSVCLVLNSILVVRPPRPAGAPSGNVLVTTPGPGTGNWAMWRSAPSAACMAVPARARTWGEIKSLYR